MECVECVGVVKGLEVLDCGGVMRCMVGVMAERRPPQVDPCRL